MIKSIIGTFALALGLGANADVTVITADAAYTMIKDQKVTIIDVRETDEFAEGHLEGSINMPLSSLNPQHVTSLKELSEETGQVLLYCRSGRRSQVAAKQLTKWGFDRPLFDIQGGIMAWQSQDLPVIQ